MINIDDTTYDAEKYDTDYHPGWLMICTGSAGTVAYLTVSLKERRYIVDAEWTLELSASRRELGLEELDRLSTGDMRGEFNLNARSTVRKVGAG